MSTATVVILALNALATVGLVVAMTLNLRRVKAQRAYWEEQEAYWRKRNEEAERRWREEVEPYL